MAHEIKILGIEAEDDICIVDQKGNLIWRLMYDENGIRLQANNGDLEVYPAAPYAIHAIQVQQQFPRVFKFRQSFWHNPKEISV